MCAPKTFRPWILVAHEWHAIYRWITLLQNLSKFADLIPNDSRYCPYWRWHRDVVINFAILQPQANMENSVQVSWTFYTTPMFPSPTNGFWQRGVAIQSIRDWNIAHLRYRCSWQSNIWRITSNISVLYIIYKYADALNLPYQKAQTSILCVSSISWQGIRLPYISQRSKFQHLRASYSD